MIGRNDPCLCGSGKKYKKCCGSSGTDIVNMVVNEELDRILTGFFDAYPQGSEKEEMQLVMRKWMQQLSESWEHTDIEEAASEFYLFVQNNKDWQSYIEEQLNHVKREAVLNVLKDWQEPILLLGEITEVKEKTIQIKALFGDQNYRMVRHEGMPADIGTLLFGVVLRDVRQGLGAIAPVSSMLFLAKWSKQTKKSLLELREAASEQSEIDFVKEHALMIYELFIKRSMASMNELIEEVLAEEQLSALTAFDTALRQLEQTTDAREIMHKLCVAYFLNENPIVEVEADFIAAAIKTGIDIGVVQGTGLDEKSIVKTYESSIEGLAAHSEKLATLYGEMMNTGDEPMAARLYAIGVDPRPTEKALWETSMTTGGVVLPERKPSIAGGRAQLLAYEAYGAATEEQRRTLAKRAIELAPHQPDALLLQAEIEEEPEKVIQLFEEAIKEASRTFEAGENPWQNIPNRPFMRAAFAYGVHLFEKGDYNDAASLFMDLLKMNQIDHQGARYEAVASLIHAKRYEEAAEILVRYEKGSGNDATYLYLDWKLEQEGSAGESPNADAMLQAAITANSHVMHLQTFQAKPIAYPKFQEIEPGSVEEARYIWFLISN